MPQSTMDSDDHLQDLTWRLRSIVGEDNVALNEPMSEHTSFRIGGPADLFVTPDDIDELRDVIAACKAALGAPLSARFTRHLLTCPRSKPEGCS